MQKFVFPLESVLQVKVSLEEVALAEFAEIQSQLISAQSRLKQTYLEKQRHYEFIARTQRGLLDIQTLVMSQEYLKKLDQSIAKQQELIAQIQEELEEKRERLVEAQRERKTLETLKEKHWQGYLKAVQREEQLFLDEVAVIRHERLGSEDQ